MSGESPVTSSSSGPAADVDQRIVSLVGKIQAKVPADKKLSAAVVVQLLTSKFQAQFPGVDFAQKTGIIEAEIKRLYSAAAVTAPSVATAPAAATATAPEAKKGKDESDDDDEEDDSDSDASEEVEESDEESDEELSSSGSDDDDEEAEETTAAAAVGADGEPALKKPRVDEHATPVGEDAEESAVAGMEASTRVPLMLAFTAKLSYRPRKQGEDESAQDYLTNYLIPFFESKQLNPNEFGKSAVKKYKLRKELNDLQADGGSLALDRTQRRGRGHFAVPPPQSETAAPRPVFMDEEEE
ncbi:Hypothetical protein, putative [Bodo saltans]|uniref:Uncharacterized protein n=1 Tax=Bodo saltans TaxID=75058 RepID=A0A0S4IQA6_BODSA|nr:Hypothetical protein, putative [Bodo saltans]|eukprot:CUE72842.1 Hypothetical protein, putative [Bodo saltans]